MNIICLPSIPENIMSAVLLTSVSRQNMGPIRGPHQTPHNGGPIKGPHQTPIASSAPNKASANDDAPRVQEVSEGLQSDFSVAERRQSLGQLD